MKKFEENKELTTEIEKLSKKNRLFQMLRLISFLLILTFIILANSYYPFLAIFSFLSFILYIVIVMFHAKIEDKLKVSKNKITVLKNYNYRVENQFQTFRLDGAKYLEEDSPYLSDLDIFGSASLFQMINICETKMGQDNLATRLKAKDDRYLKDVLKVAELKDKIDFSIAFQANNYGYSKDSSKVSLEVTLEELKKEQKPNLLLDYLVPVIQFVLTLISLIFFIIKGEISYFLVMLIVNLVLAFAYSFLKAENFKSIKAIVLSLTPLAKNYELITNTSFNNKDLNITKEVIANGNNSMSSLKKIDTLVSLQQNFFGNLVCNMLLPFSVIVYLSYVFFLKKHNVELENSIKEYTNLEALLSLAIIPQVKENTCVPKRIDNIEISFTDLKHPLIKEDVCVSNSLNVKPSLNIITGSNMSGKTSFLRTIGINLVLMYAGGLTNATSFESDMINVYSSMRITDDIKNGISTFYRELLTIKSAIKDAKANVKSIILIDEVFRGTNSNDRIEGAISLIKHLDLPNVILFMTTHDFELCKVEGVNNYHFTEHYIDDKIAFDYKLKDGRCTTTNAIYLMKLAGVIND